MSFIAVSVGGTVLGVVGGVVGSVVEANAAADAADKQQQAARDANKLQWDIFQTQRADQRPWMDAGRSALIRMNNGDFQRDFTMNDFQADPGYEF